MVTGWWNRRAPQRGEGQLGIVDSWKEEIADYLMKMQQPLGFSCQAALLCVCEGNSFLVTLLAVWTSRCRKTWASCAAQEQVEDEGQRTERLPE